MNVNDNPVAGLAADLLAGQPKQTKNLTVYPIFSPKEQKCKYIPLSNNRSRTCPGSCIINAAGLGLRQACVSGQTTARRSDAASRRSANVLTLGPCFIG